VLLARRRLDRGDDLARDAQLGEGAERGLQLGVEVTDRLVEADHALLDDVLAVGADQEVRAGLDAGERAVLVQQLAQGGVAAAAGLHDEVVVGLAVGVAPALADGGAAVDLGVELGDQALGLRDLVDQRDVAPPTRASASTVVASSSTRTLSSTRSGTTLSSALSLGSVLLVERSRSRRTS
jgi:hypothetical protein